MGDVRYLEVVYLIHRIFNNNMGILDKKERVFDVILTDKGRELLSKNQLNFKYYAFSDEGVNYSGSLSSSLVNSSSIDDHVHNMLTFEADLRSSAKNKRTLSSFIYTNPSENTSIPDMVVSHDTGSIVNIERAYWTVDPEGQNSDLDIARRIDYAKMTLAIVRRHYKEEGLEERELQQALTYHMQNLLTDLLNGEDVAGRFIGDTWVFIANNALENVNTGEVINFSSTELSDLIDDPEEISDPQLEVVEGMSFEKIEFSLKTNTGTVDAKNGFLVEVFESGSDGRLTRLKTKNQVDPLLPDKVTERGFSEYIKIEVDE